jgi:hypothetical protein
MSDVTITRGDRVMLKGCMGRVEALTKPYAKDEVKRHYVGGRWRTMTTAYAGDRLAMIKWDDLAAAGRFNKWINTRHLTLVEGE